MTQLPVHHVQPTAALTLAGGQIADRYEDQPAPEGLQMTLLGFPQVALGGRAVTFMRRGSVALLTYLALTRRVHSREALIALLADDFVDEKARRHLSNVLHELTALLGDSLLVTRQTIAFNTARPYTLDVAAFEVALAAAKDGGSIDPLQAAVDSYQHELLEGFGLRSAVAFEEWLLVERERLNSLLVQGLALLGEEYSRRGEYSAGLACANRWLAIDPWDEAAHRQAMRLLALSGRRNAALAQYEQCRRRLEDDLGVEPAAETTRLHEQLRCAPISPPHNLPLQPTPFIGRRRELARLAEQLDDPACRLLAIVGMGGMGKTRLALQAAAHAAHGGSLLDTHRFPGGVFYVPLDDVAADTSRRDVQSAAAYAILNAIAQTLGIPADGTVDLAAHVRRALPQCALLLVLDNIEHLRHGVMVVEQLLRQAPNVTLLVTSRVQLGLSASWTLDLGPMEVPQGADEIDRADASLLFLQQARQARMLFEPTEDDREAIVRICQLADGAPLPIVLAARQLRMASCPQLAERLAGDLSCVTSRLHNLAERHRSLRANFTYSWFLLDDTERRVLRMLAVFGGAFSAQAAAVVASTTLLQLDTLADAGLVASAGDERFSIPGLLRPYAAEMLRERPAEEADARARLAAYANQAPRAAAIVYRPERRVYS
jgi:DNA-binding SARP family transcriptional activator/predicted ATPase